LFKNVAKAHYVNHSISLITLPSKGFRSNHVSMCYLPNGKARLARCPRLRGFLASPGPREKNAKVGALRGARLAYAPTAPCIAFSVINLCLPTLLCCFALGSRTSRQRAPLISRRIPHKGSAVSGQALNRHPLGGSPPMITRPPAGRFRDFPRTLKLHLPRPPSRAPKNCI
jgi:hypothetical protein